MCGITGFWSKSKAWREDDLVFEARKMGHVIEHRGPDSDGIWVDEASALAFAHQRLSVIDLSPHGHQPMSSSCGRYILCYNGEIYNAGELKQQLPSWRQNFRGYSDTEVILECFAEWSVEETIPKMIGMFAFALWDREGKVLWLVRDRLGIKPLYWSLLPDDTLLFGSEIGAIEAHKDFDESIDFSSVSGFMRCNYVPAPNTIFENVHKLLPGHILRLDLRGKDPEIKSYWDISQIYLDGYNAPFTGSDSEALDKLDELITDAISRRMIADVPLGAFLSGGIDSSCVTAIMQKLSNKPIRTFSIGFDEQDYNEARHAANVAKYLGTDHTELYVSTADLLAVIPKLPSLFDEPFADSSQIPTYLVSALARKDVTVALSGDGGDELFAGYDRYTYAGQICRKVDRVPSSLRKIVSRGIQSVSERQWDAILHVIPNRFCVQNLGHKLHKFSHILTKNQDDIYRSLISHWETQDIFYRENEKSGSSREHDCVPSQIDDTIMRMQLIDIINYLPGDILTKVDRASMAVALEARVPLLDHRIVEFAATLPRRMKIRDGQSKWLLKQILYRYVPKHIVDRPKMGFGVPVGQWIKGPLREWAEDLLSPQMFARHCLLKPGPVLQKWKEHKDGKADWQYMLWDVLMLHAWAEHRKTRSQGGNRLT